MAIWSGSGLSGSMIAAGAAATLVVAGAVGYQYFGETDAPQDPAPQVEVTGLPETTDPAPPLPEAAPETPMEAAPEPRRSLNPRRTAPRRRTRPLRSRPVSISSASMRRAAP